MVDGDFVDDDSAINAPIRPCIAFVDLTDDKTDDVIETNGMLPDVGDEEAGSDCGHRTTDGASQKHRRFENVATSETNYTHGRGRSACPSESSERSESTSD